VDEDFEFGVGAVLADAGDFVEGQLAGQDHPRDAGHFQKRTAAPLTVLACTERWMGISGKFSRTIMIRPRVGHDQGVGPRAMTGAMSLMKVLILAPWG
jgi:hypothetical protein